MSSFKTPPRYPHTPNSRGTPLFCVTTPTRGINRSSAFNTLRSDKRNTPGDRYIPNRAVGNMEFARYKVECQTPNSNRRENTTNTSPNQRESHALMREKLLSLKGKSSETRVLSFKQTIWNSSSFSNTSGKYEYWSPYVSSQQPKIKKKARKLPKSAEKILDAPSLINDYYLNILDYSSSYELAIALGGAVYLLDTLKGNTTTLCELQPSSLYISSLRWNRTGKYLAVGTSDAEVQLWDVMSGKLVRRMHTHKSRVDSLAWSPKTSLLSSGDQLGFIHHYDPRMAQFHVASVRAHKMDVCGLRWSPNGRFLASGGNDNVVKIWDTYSKNVWNTPAHTIKHHTAAVKALSWCPWKPNLLATGGGSADKRICLWNSCNGQMECETNTDSQVSGLLWCSHYQELLSSHGNPSNKLNLWKLEHDQSDTGEERSTLTKVGELPGHDDRILHVSLSSDEQTVVSAAADETLKFWKCFTKEYSGKDKSGYRPSDNDDYIGDERLSSQFNMLKFVR